MSLTRTPVDSPPTYSRRFGRTYHHLDQLAEAILCSEKFGKVKVDCRLKVSESQWGHLGLKPRNPAGIIYMDLSFDQPFDCQLANATVQITLVDPNTTPGEGEGHHPHPRRLQGPPHSQPTDDCSRLRMTDYWGPRRLTGKPTSAIFSRTLNTTPQINVLGNGFGGLGINTSKTVRRDGRWEFRGQRVSTPEAPTIYRSLKWELCENELGGRSLHNSVIHTGFTLQHGNQPFLMHIKIKGQLQSKRDHMKDAVRRFKKFPSSRNPDQGFSETIVRPTMMDKPLDLLAERLSDAMNLENSKSDATQVPDVHLESESGAVTSIPATPVPYIHVNNEQEVPSTLLPGTGFANAISAIEQKFPMSNRTSFSATLVDEPQISLGTDWSTNHYITKLGDAISVFHSSQGRRRRQQKTPPPPPPPLPLQLQQPPPRDMLRRGEEGIPAPSHRQLLLQLLRYPNPLLAFAMCILEAVVNVVLRSVATGTSQGSHGHDTKQAGIDSTTCMKLEATGSSNAEMPGSFPNALTLEALSVANDNQNHSENHSLA